MVLTRVKKFWANLTLPYKLRKTFNVKATGDKKGKAAKALRNGLDTAEERHYLDCVEVECEVCKKYIEDQLI